MADIVNVHEAKTHLSRLLEEVKQGREIILAKSGTPVARLVPYEAIKARIPGMAEGAFDESFFDPLPEEELAAWGQ
ncbi:MAG: type II toxin-antitoxin system prevent-host-death family antitoxin [Smithellaceae bacterium]|nr:type II toxin-antitoxin system prevent-host-death family antitoxin [Smithellaceae bacterium]